ncbi:DNA-directed RNA polymerase subunit alpha C-terminal domain-containing protein [Bradyrhizobium erythrophlei]|uniref:DNA-directed RNA polymerase subunit alpha C-terminal domain-containing protein n=1 Tax=Bradyrhizobium erythrophlei TaxID=1437360 RepID=UPI0009345DAB
MKLKPSFDLPNRTRLEDVNLPARIQNVLALYGIKTVGELRVTRGTTLLTFQDMGPRSVAYLRNQLGLAD